MHLWLLLRSSLPPSPLPHVSLPSFLLSLLPLFFHSFDSFNVLPPLLYSFLSFISFFNIFPVLLSEE